MKPAISLHDTTLERAVLSEMLGGSAPTNSAQRLLRPEDFYDAKHGLIFAAAVSVLANGGDVDPFTVSDQLERDGNLARIGGKDFIGKLVDEAVTSIHIESHANVIREKANLRGMAMMARAIEAKIQDGMSSKEIAQFVSEAALPFSIDEAGPGFRHVRDLLHQTLEAIEARGVSGGGLRTGYQAIDDRTNGFRPGELFIPAAAEKLGKSAFALNVGLNVLEQSAGSVGVGYVSAEMTAGSIIDACPVACNRDCFRQARSREARQIRMGMRRARIEYAREVPALHRRRG